MNQQPYQWDWTRQRVRGAVACLRAEDPQGALHTVEELCQADYDGSPAARCAADVLVDASADMLQALCTRTGPAAQVGMLLGDTNGVEIPIDEVDPPLRASFRAVLAEVNEDHESAEMQLDLLFERDDPEDKAIALLHLLMWTTNLVKDCELDGTPPPAWLVGVGD